MKRLLIVSPHFPPVNAPDMQRVRMSLPHFVKAGWEVTVLTADDREPQAPLEPALLQTVPDSVRVIRVPCLSRRWTRFFGLNNLAWRMLPFLATAGIRLIRTWRPSVIYFSTTQFTTMPLGRLWRRSYGLPYVIDLQDPWVNDYYRQPGAPPPPGGWKYRFADASARLLEGWTLRRSAHVISVSARYLDDLARRYPWWTPDRGSVLTFGAPDEDFALLRARPDATRALLPAGKRSLRIAYAGRLGPDMLPTLEVLFAAVARCRDATRPVELYFFGTSYAGADRAESTGTACAQRHGIADLVHEQPARIGYLDSLRLLIDTDVALVLGSEDQGYSPSKIYPTLLAGRPTMAIAPTGSVLAGAVEELGGAALVTYRPQPTADDQAVAALTGLLQHCIAGRPLPAPPLDRARLEVRHSAAAVARRQLEIFSRVIGCSD
jgi:hypothetical protein